jgi:hypothetical protein
MRETARLVDPTESVAPHSEGFCRQFVGLFGCTRPADLALYRAMLPACFAMPAEPRVCFYFIDFKATSIGPYHEASILLPVSYRGEQGKYALTMPLDSEAAARGRAAGFPKYMTRVSLVQSGDRWTGSAGSSEVADLRADYTGRGAPDPELPWPDFFNIAPIPVGEVRDRAFLPPRAGRVLRIPGLHLVPPTWFSLRGSVTLAIREDLPWAGLVDASAPFPGLLVRFKGGINLGRQPMDPE